VPVAGAALSHLRGTWTPGAFSLGRLSGPVTYAATLWVAFETINIAWPRPIPGAPWYVAWSMLITTVVLGTIGLVIYLGVRGRIEAPIGDRLKASVARMASAAAGQTSDALPSGRDPAENPTGATDTEGASKSP
jgi:hypothetical protein